MTSPADPTPSQPAPPVPSPAGPPPVPSAADPSAVAPSPAGKVVLPPDRRHAILRGTVGGLLVAAGAVMWVAGYGFPYNAPVESLYNFGLIVDVVVAGAVLAALAFPTARRWSRPTIRERVGPFALIAVICGLLVLVLWLGQGLTFVLEKAADGGRQRYMYTTGPIFMAGIPWAAALVFGTLALRGATGRRRVLALVGLGSAALLLVPAVWAAVAYGLGLTD